ncbi:MAG TPA: AsmA family protein, partial [Geminicoccaceae bacterium]|nr:AsmA family protein [Geminicoccaceae bacterium]
MRRVGAALLGLVLLVVAGAALFVATVDPNDHKALIERWASDALGQTVRVAGPIELSRSLTPTLVVSDLSIGGDTAPAPISIGRAELSLALPSLLFGPLHLPLVAIERAELDLPLQMDLSAGGGGAQVPRIDQITLTDIAIRYRSAARPFEATVAQASFVPAASGSRVDIRGAIGAVPLHLSGTTGAVADLFAGA